MSKVVKIKTIITASGTEWDLKYFESPQDVVSSLRFDEEYE